MVAFPSLSLSCFFCHIKQPLTLCALTQRLVHEMAPPPLHRSSPEKSARSLPLRLLHGEHPQRSGRPRQGTAEGAVPGYDESVGE